MLAHPLPGRGPGPAPTTTLVRPSPSIGRRAGLVAAGAVGLAVVIVLSVVDNSTTSWIYRGASRSWRSPPLRISPVSPSCPAAVPGHCRSAPCGTWAPSHGLYLYHWPIFVVVDHARTGLSAGPCSSCGWGCRWPWPARSFHFLEMPVRRGALRGWRAWVGTPLAVGATAALLVGATAGATTAVNAEPAAAGARRSGRAVRRRPGTAAVVASVPAGTAGPVRVLLVGDSEASFLGFGLGPERRPSAELRRGRGLRLRPHDRRDAVPRSAGERQRRRRGGHLPVPCGTQLVRWKADVDAFHPDVVLLADGEYEVRDQRVGSLGAHRETGRR